MRSFHSFLVCGFALALAGCASGGAKQQTSQPISASQIAPPALADVDPNWVVSRPCAVIRAVVGNAEYSTRDGQMHPLNANQVLPEGATLVTVAGAQVDLQANGRTSTLRMMEETKVTLETVRNSGKQPNADTATVLDLKAGTLLGSVKKLSKDSLYRVKTPKGTMVIRGTDFSVSVLKQPNGEDKVTFAGVTGQLICVANVKVYGVDTLVTRMLTTGQTWTPSEGEPVTAEPQGLGPGRRAPNGTTESSPPQPFYVPPTTDPKYLGGSDSTYTPPIVHPFPGPPPVPTGPHPGPPPNPVATTTSMTRH
jgi:hypothetical protein